MSFNIECPGCLTPYSLPDGERGKPFRCTTCHNVFVAGAEAEAEAPRIVQPVDAVAADAPKMIQLIDEEPFVAMPVDSRETARRSTADKRSAPPQAPRKRKRSGERLAVLITAMIAVVMVGGAGAAIGYRVWTAPEKKQTQKTGSVVSQVPRPRGIIVQPVTRRVALDCEDREVQDIFFSDEATHQAVVLRTSGDRAMRADRYDLVGGKRLSGFTVNVRPFVTRRMSLSPGGSRFAYEDERADVVIVSALDGTQAARWRPYVPQPVAVVGDLPLEHALARLEFIAEDRLLTINQAGGMDLWKVPELQPMYHIAGKPARAFADPRIGLGVSFDRKTLAVFNRDGFELRDTATGALQRETARLAKFNTVDGCRGVAFGADGKTVAAALMVRQWDRPEEVLASWDVATGQLVSDARLPEGSGTAQVLWWSPKYMIVGGATPAKESVALECPSGVPVRQMEAGYWQKNGLIAPNSPDGRLWFVAGTDDSTKAFLATVDMPENERRIEGDRPKERWWLTANGIMK
jgi:hypothetical protein